MKNENDSQGGGTDTSRPMSILILHRDSDVLGGVEKYFLKIRDKFSEPIEYYTMGRRPGEQGFLSLIVRMAGDYVRFTFLLLKRRFDVIHINPSVDRYSFLRDGVFHLLCRLFRQKTIVFFRGWYSGGPFERVIDRHSWMFRLFYGHANAYIVLSREYELKIRDWGATATVYREVVVADDAELDGFDIKQQIDEREKSSPKRILFAARVTRNKGVYELLQAFAGLRKSISEIRLIIAGDSDELDTVKRFTEDLGVTGVEFKGYVTGDERDELFKTSHIFCLPTYYEGFPNAVVEAMAVGLPVVTRAVGGLRDFFTDRIHGFATESKDPDVFANYLRELVMDQKLYGEISLNNYNYAQEHFLASRAAIRLEEIYRAVHKNPDGGV